MNNFPTSSVLSEKSMEGMFSNGRVCCKTTITSLLDECPWDLIFACCWEVALWKARHNEETPESRSQASFPGRILSSHHLWELRWIKGEVQISQASFPARIAIIHPPIYHLWEWHGCKLKRGIRCVIVHLRLQVLKVFAFNMKYTHNHTYMLPAFCPCEILYMYLCLYLYLYMCLHLYLY